MSHLCEDSGVIENKGLVRTVLRHFVAISFVNFKAEYEQFFDSLFDVVFPDISLNGPAVYAKQFCCFLHVPISHN